MTEKQKIRLHRLIRRHKLIDKKLEDEFIKFQQIMHKNLIGELIDRAPDTPEETLDRRM